MAKWVYSFGTSAEGRAEMRNLLGGKGANLAEMANLGLPVPPGFTITTEVCTHFYASNKTYPADLAEQAAAALAKVEKAVGRRFGDDGNPLLVSVRSGARASMPGMMDTVLNLGLNDATVEGLATASGDKRFAYDSYRRFIQMYGQVVLGVEHHLFEDVIEAKKLDSGVNLDTQLKAEDWQDVIAEYKALVERQLAKPFPQDPQEQLWGAIGAVFGSWMNQRAITYRRLHEIPADWGTAVNVQAMVFGNMGDDCATGVAFTRDPSTGANAFYGEFLVNAQGEDVVAGIRTPQHLTIAGKEANHSSLPAMEEVMPQVFAELEEGARDLRAALPRYARHRIHGAAEQALHAANAQRQAHRAGGAEDRRRHGECGADRPQRGVPPHRAFVARPAPASDARPQGREDRAGARLAGLAGRRLGGGRVLGR